ncbi:uncharacterized protein LOC124889603 [Capsicum annuum]|uniref:uncharacterized protein LOC124889603 n=1 Tax=Capsicum annuum TaxID=4072 RepID=UPI001FB106B2|nr:uncharacterized protein LOC124889603 [Capsicum annuum]
MDTLDDPKIVYNAENIQRDMKRQYDLDLSYCKAHRTKKKALEMLRGDPGHILSIAYAIVDSENNASWESFFERLKEAIGVRERIYFVSDRHQGILRAISIVYSGVPHCICIWHLWNNIKENYRRNQQQLREIVYAMQKVERIDKRVKDYLFDIGYQKWARTHATVNRTMIMTSNITESVNLAIKDERDLLVRPLTDYLHTVTHKGRTFIVRIKEQICTCRRFQLDVGPCSHALEVLKSKRLKSEDYCSIYYTIAAMKKTYEISINPIPDETS